MRSRSAWLRALASHADERPSAVALSELSVHGEVSRSLRWRELAELATGRAACLRASLPAGATVVAALASGLDLAPWLAGAIASGMRLVLMHPRCGPGEFATVCARANANAGLAHDALYAQVQQPMLKLIPAISCTGTRTSSARPREPETAGSIVLGSSGVSGMPKLVLRESAALDADAAGVSGGLSLAPDDAVLCVPPLCHSYGMDLLLGAVWAGSETRFMTEFGAGGIAAQLLAGATVVAGVPFAYESLGRGDPLTPAQRGACRVRTAISAGSPLSDRVRTTFAERWGIRVGQLYGATELGAASVELADCPDFEPGSIGRPLPGVSFRIVALDDPTRLCPAGQEGQLAVKSPAMLTTYLGEEPRLVDGHLPMGDLVRVDASGKATLAGRLKDLIDVGGFKVNPLEVELALLDHPGVGECAVTALPLSDTINKVHALVVPRRADALPATGDLRHFLLERLAPVKVPRSFEIVPSLPRSALGKLLRNKLPKGST